MGNSGRMIASGGGDNTIAIWDHHLGSLVQILGDKRNADPKKGHSRESGDCAMSLYLLIPPDNENNNMNSTRAFIIDSITDTSVIRYLYRP